LAFLAHESVAILKLHQEHMSVGRANWRVRYALCKHMSQPPRPDWRECLRRAKQDSGSDLLDARTESSKEAELKVEAASTD
jgi:hypothetical protein